MSAPEVAINPFVEEFVNITYNGLQAQKPDLQVTIEAIILGSSLIWREEFTPL